MKQKILNFIAIGSIISMTLTGCGVNASYKNPASGEETTYVAEFPDGQQVKISAEDAEAIKEAQEELDIIEESVYEDIEEDEEDIEEETKDDPFNINAALGSKKGEHTSLGVTYTIYENGAEIVKIENEHAVIAEEVEFEGATYPVVSIGGIFHTSNDFEIPSHIKYINGQAFSSCFSLESLIIPETVEYISGYYTFNDCRNLKSITFLGEFETDSEWWHTFHGCENLETIIVPEGVTDLGYYTFAGCSSLTSVTLPKSLKTIGEKAFDVCKSLETVLIPDGVELIDMLAFELSGIKYIDIPESVQELSLSAFHKCNELEELYIPDTVTSYGRTSSSYPLSGDSLKILKFSNNCNDILSVSAPHLELLIFPDSTEEIDKNYFYAIENQGNLTIQVPEKTVDYFANVFPEINVVAKE